MKHQPAALKLLLWDIDGTLVHTGKAGEIAMGVALKRKFDIDGSIHDVDYPGRTDRMICGMLLEHYGISATDEAVHDFVEGYLEALQEELPRKQGRVLPGILVILQQCRDRPDIINALLTGNMSRGAELKLAHYDVWDFFEFGAFADDAPDRNQLGLVALQRAATRLGIPLDPQHVFVIGDTPHDISCGKVIGARTIAVATGAYPVESLRQHQPDHVFADFSQTDDFLGLL